MAMAREPLLVVATSKELLFVATTLATLNELLLITTTLRELNITCCNNTKGVTCYRTTTTTMALNEMHLHLCSNFQGINGRSLLFIDSFVVGKMLLKLDPL
jgi:hypothetical protein